VVDVVDVVDVLDVRALDEAAPGGAR